MALLNPLEPPGNEPRPSAPAYTTRPLINSITPSTGRIGGGTTVTISGGYFGFGGVPTVTFGGVAATSVTVVDQQTITCVIPAHAVGIVNVVVTAPNGESRTLTSGFTYISSTITRLTPQSGPSTGGTAVTIWGTNFVTGSTVTFGGAAATSVVFVDSGRVTCVTPPGSAGASVDVVITEPSTASNTLTHAFLYAALALSEAFVTQLNGPHTSQARRSSVQIHTELGNSPNTATFVTDGAFTMPNVGDDVSFTDNGILKFAGTLLSREQTYEEAAVNAVYTLNCSDYAWTLNRFRPKGAFKDRTISGIIRSLVAEYASGFTVVIDSNFESTATVTFSGESSFADALSSLTARVGNAHWKVDYQKVIHVFVGTDPSLVSPTKLVDGLATLPNDPPVRVHTDLSQIRNKVTVAGSGTSSVADPFKTLYPYGLAPVVPGTFNNMGYAYIAGNGAIPVGSIDGFNPNGGNCLINGLQCSYSRAGFGYETGESWVTDTSNTPVLYLTAIAQELFNTVLNLYQPPYWPAAGIQQSAYYSWDVGVQVVPVDTEQDDASIAQYGIHEFFISDSNIRTYADLSKRSLAELANFAWPLVTINYDTWDEQTVAGAQVDVDMAHPQVSGSFVIQTVTIGSYYSDSDKVGVRYSVVANKTYTPQTSVARFHAVDLMLYLDKHLNQPGVGQGVATPPAVPPAPTATVSAATGVQSVTFTLTAAQVNSLNTVPYQALAAPGAGNVIVGVAAYGWQNVTTTFSVLNNMAFRWASFVSGQDLCGLFSFTNGPNTANLVSKPIANFSFTANKDPRNQPVIFYATGDCTGGGTSTFVITLLYAIVAM
jgi:hypothetical protein